MYKLVETFTTTLMSVRCHKANNPNSFSEGTLVQIELFQLDKFPTMEYNYTLFPHP
jgi:hypothetical protein